MNYKKTHNKKNKINRKNKTRKKNTMKRGIKIIEASKLLTDDYMKSKEGEYFDEKHYNSIINSDCDCYYYDENNTKKILFKFRKNVFPKKYITGHQKQILKKVFKNG